MPSAGSSFSKSSNEEVINHYGAVRMRIVGSGNLRMVLYSLDEVKSFTLLPITLAAKTNIEPNRISNFTQQRAKFELRTTEIDESFNSSKIIVFAKPVAKSYPE